MKRIIVAGGTGLIGQAFIKKMIEADKEVVLLTRKQHLEGLPSAVQLVQWDGKTTGDWQHWLEGAQAVVNLAGENIGAGVWTSQRKLRIVASRVDAGRALVTALKQTSQRPQVFLQASAIGYYGITTGQPATESSPAGRGYLPSVCLDWEGSTLGVEALGLRRVVVRTGIVLARDGGALPPMLPLFRFFAGGPLGSGRQVWSWISMADEVAAMAWLLENKTASGVYNLTAPTPATMAEIGHTLAKVLKRPYWLPAPAFALRLVLGEMSSLVLDSQNIYPQRLLDSGYAFQYTQLKGAIESLGLTA
jgi:uncharacterized protein (TIGR01777 family)